MRRTPAILLALALAGCSGVSSTTGPSPDVTSSAPSASPSRTGSESPSPSQPARIPELSVEVVASGLVHPWDVGFLPDKTMLVTERPGRLVLVSSTRTTPVDADLGDVFAQGEGGLLGMVLHPDFATSRRFTACLDHAEGGVPVDIRLVTFALSTDGSSATRVKDLLTGLPISTGRHSGCRLAIAPDGALIVGTGDTAQASVPQDLTSLGGKTLRLDLETGRPFPGNPFGTAVDRTQRYVYTYGHRNVQGLAVRPNGQLFSVEHGTSVDDEVNLLAPGANFGYDPSAGGTRSGYPENSPMTDRRRFPDAVEAVWSSGDPTEATSGADFLVGEEWGALDGSLAVAALKGSKLIVLTLDASGQVTSVMKPASLDGTHGRLRAARLGPDGALYLTTSNGEDDELLRVTPE